MEYLLVVAVAALAGYLAYRVSVSLGRRVAGDEVLQVPPPTRRTTGAAGPVGDPGTPHPIGADPGTPDPVAGAPGTPHPVAAPTGGAGTRPGSRRPRRRAGTDPGPDAFAYGSAPLPPLRIPARTRLLGILGLIALVVLAAALIAIALYQAGHLIRLQFEGYLR